MRGQQVGVVMRQRSFTAGDILAGLLQDVESSPLLGKLLGIGAAYANLMPQLRIATTHGENIEPSGSVWDRQGDLVVYSTSFARFIEVVSLGGEKIYDGPVDRRSVQTFEDVERFLQKVVRRCPDMYSFMKYSTALHRGRLPRHMAGRKEEICAVVSIGRSPSRRKCNAMLEELWEVPSHHVPNVMAVCRGCVGVMVTNEAGRHLLGEAMYACSLQERPRLMWILEELLEVSDGDWLRLLPKPFDCHNLMMIFWDCLPPAVRRQWRVPRLSALQV